MDTEVLSISTQRMLELMQWLIDGGIVSSQRDFFAKIGSSHGNITHVKNGSREFATEHILKAIMLWQDTTPSLANPYYLFNLPKPKKR